MSMLQTRTKQLLLLARIREKAGQLTASLSTLKEARDNQFRLQKRISLEQSGGMQEQHKIMAKYAAQILSFCLLNQNNRILLL